MDWKIMAASFAALAIVSSVLIGGFGIGGFFSDIINTIGEFLSSSPFGGLPAISSGSSVVAVKLAFYPSEFTLTTEHGINAHINDINLEMFDGEIQIYYQNSTIILKPRDTDMTIDLRLQEIVVEDLTLSKLNIEETRFEIEGSDTAKTTGTGTVEISDFSGTFAIKTNRIEFEGNVSVVSVTTGESHWELK
jgi:hypothetical protein